MQVNILEAKNRLSELAGGGTILKPLIVAQIPHLTPQSTPHSSVIPAQAGNRAPAMAHKQRGGSPRQDQPQIL